MSARPVRIANCSGFYGDRLSAAREMVEGGPIDVLTGDYLAEPTMLILWKARRKDADPDKVGLRFSDATVALALGGYAGCHATTPLTSESSYDVYCPALVPAGAVEHVVHLPDGTTTTVPHSPTEGAEPATTAPPAPAGETVGVPLGRLAGARSGDTGGNADVGFWAGTTPPTPGSPPSSRPTGSASCCPRRPASRSVCSGCPTCLRSTWWSSGCSVKGVAASARPDPQAKGLREYLRSRLVDVPAELVP